MIQLPTRAAEDLRKSERDNALTFAAAFAVVTLVMTFAAALFGLVLAIPFAGYLTAILFLAGGIGVALILLIGFRRGSAHISKLAAEFVEWSKLHYDIEWHKLNAPKPAAPATPDTVTEYRVIPSNIKSNGIPVQIGSESVTVRVPDLKIVVLDGNLLRAYWLGEKDSSPREPFKGVGNPRQYFDATVKILDDTNLTKRGANNGRQLVHAPAVTWSMLQLE